MTNYIWASVMSPKVDLKYGVYILFSGCGHLISTVSTTKLSD